MLPQKVEPNRLINEKSPYLLQHAYNPVDWYPWGDEAFERARQENKPILLSIGYSTCHWCHVMEKESFADLNIAEQMNNNFICIKVDREERPDLDKIYITAVTSLTGSAGWPLNVFLTPDLKPFFGGTYFPPRSGHGIASWPDLINLITKTWRDPAGHKKILDSATEITLKLKSYLSGSAPQERSDNNLLEEAYNSFKSSYDETKGGFGSAPKFPSPTIQNFLLAYSFYAAKIQKNELQAEKALKMAEFTLSSMAKGGIYDHLGGGFHRYATDDKWHVPHFEKMLYDNAQLITTYLDAFLITKDPFFSAVAANTADYVLRDMTQAEGGFYSAEDADSLPATSSADKRHQDKIEGAFYVWDQKEINRILGPETGPIIAYLYGVRSEGNVGYDPHGDFEDKNILFVDHLPEEAAAKFTLSSTQIQQIISESRLKLMQARATRSRPHLDDKIIVSWNGLMISAMARAYQVFGESNYLRAAQKAAMFINKNLYNPETRQLLRRWRQGDGKISGLAEDFAFLTQGLLDLYEADFDYSWLQWAAVLTDELIKLFYDAADGGFFITPKDHDSSLIVRVKEDNDSVIPAAGSVAVSNLMRLARLLSVETYSTIAEKSLRAMLSFVQRYPGSAAQLLVSKIVTLIKPVEIIIAGKRDKEDTRLMLKAVRSVYRPGKIIMLADGDAAREQLPLIASVALKSDRATAYVCRDHTCLPPVSDPTALSELLER